MVQQASARTYKIDRLNYSNYQPWRMTMELLLQSRDLMGVVDGTSARPAAGHADLADWIKSDLAARLELLLHMEDTQKHNVRCLTSAKEIWDRLKDSYKHKDVSSQVTLLKKLTNLSMDETSSVKKFLESWRNALDDVALSGLALPENVQAVMLLAALPSSWQAFISTKSVATLTVPTLIPSIMQEQTLRMSKQQPSTSSPASGKQKYNQAHYDSGSNTETESEAGDSESYDSQSSTEDAHLCFSADTYSEPLPYNVHETSWLLDSGATCNLTSTKDHLTSYKPLRRPFPVRFGNKSTCLALTVGTAEILLQHCGNPRCLSCSKYCQESDLDKTSATVLQQFKTYQKLAENHLEQFINTLQTDNGGEYTSQVFKAYCAQQGIHHNLTVPHTLQQNGLAERKNHSLMNSARNMLRVAGLPPSFWEEAVSTACYLQNRSYSRTFRGIPYSLWYGKEPDYSSLRIFGCTCYAFIPALSQNKLDDRALKAIFVGYGEPHGVKGYRLYDPVKKDFLFSRSLVFDESSLISTPEDSTSAPSDDHSLAALPSALDSKKIKPPPSLEPTPSTTVTWVAPFDPEAVVPHVPHTLAAPQAPPQTPAIPLPVPAIHPITPSSHIPSTSRKITCSSHHRRSFTRLN
ncbi:hypothetical protein L7F22_013853 [Adiantum nelumboides]|nr:hypothetical protein [Adiantum nelumboides]